jgi:lipopolysaccharide/colanic/teichoic acid biosynthesis glycosyltransferase
LNSKNSKYFRLLEITTALLFLLLFSILLFFSWLVAAIDTQTLGVFVQKRIGKNGASFSLYKLRTIRPKSDSISFFGRCLRKSKLDEPPQLINILAGKMSFVGPRPDIPGYADHLAGEDRQILQLRPGITGLASIKYRNEEALLAQQLNPQVYNDTVIWPDKVRINKWYLQNRSFAMDVKIIIHTLYPSNFDVDHYINSHPQS